MIQLPKVGQVGVVVKDVKAAARFLTDGFGIGPFSFIEFKQGKARFKGATTAYQSKVAMCNYQGMAIELIEPVAGDTIQNDPAYLPPGGQGIHHLGFFVPNAAELAAAWEGQGAKVIQVSSPMPGSATIYLDTPQYAGVLVELIQLGGFKWED